MLNSSNYKHYTCLTLYTKHYTVYAHGKYDATPHLKIKMRKKISAMKMKIKKVDLKIFG